MTINTGTAELCLERVPKGTIRPIINMGYLLFKTRNIANGIKTPDLDNPYKIQDYLIKHKPEKDWIDNAIKLPPGSYTLLGICPEISEDEWGKVVDSEFDTYRDYSFEDEIGSYVLTSATDSARSLISFAGYTWEETVVMIKK
ncbi:MAG: hypothetical protein K0S09_32 [Sphingobacteriaceae bacterium]|jgi:hypothetical protein|nr:hypothetical protein [Sphingobacteriaceae bacterium]